MKKIIIGFGLILGAIIFVDSPSLVYANDQDDSLEEGGGNSGCKTGQVNDATCRSGYPACGFIMSSEQVKDCNYSRSIGA
ncbi:hypothetical protein [Belliella pelovolcani]|uniref:Uncharacterized protein n=1 Tax=Belliella pelovolcani TaxID=529505 RepID=A0A1N7M2S7_9BACT|nr:hypothetical protein [Belliella pelovolcani]SIS80387.1 hypothetical protein SAMN05421761_10542 [Belliella pelovolcani]